MTLSSDLVWWEPSQAGIDPAGVGALLSAAYSFRYIAHVFLGPVRDDYPSHPHDPGVGMWWPPALLVAIVPLHFLFNLGLGSITARLAVPFRDINNFIPYINRMWLYLTPIIWPLTLLDDAGPTLTRVVELNPMFHFIGLYRTALIGYPGYPFQLDDLLVSMAWAVAIFIIGVAGFIRYETRMVRYL